ncbi:RICIN domain-containing protein [Salinibacterium sp. SYSU T00001]|nr:RICIN domain-containing protein [Salinibacterium sedimenticola]
MRRNLLHSVGIGALVSLLLASGAGVTFAVWTASTAVTSSATGAQLAVTTSFVGALDAATFQNHSNTVTGTVTVTNTSNVAASQSANKSVARPVSTKLNATVAAPNAAKVSQFTVTAWSTSSPATCATQSVPVGAAQGTWASIPALTTELAPGASITYCVRATAAERTNLGVSGGAFTITPTVTSTLTIAGSSWSATATGSAAQATSHIYPAASLSTGHWMRIADTTNTSCLDVNSASDTEGQALISYACKSNNDAGKTNQRWRLVADGNYYRIVTQLSSGRAFAAAGNSTTPGTGIVMTTASTTSAQWQAQEISSGVYQLVNRASGLCLTRGTASGGVTPMTQAVCGATTAQRYVFTQDTAWSTITSLTCSTSGRNVVLTWSPATSQTYVVRQYTSNNQSSVVTPDSRTSTSVTLSPDALSGNSGTKTIELDGGTDGVWRISVDKNWNGFIFGYYSLSCNGAGTQVSS